MNLKEVMERFFQQLKKKDVIDESEFSKRYGGKMTNLDIAKYFGVTPDAIIRHQREGSAPFSKMIPVCIDNDLDINYIFNDRLVESYFVDTNVSEKKIDNILERLGFNMIKRGIIDEFTSDSRGKSALIGKSVSSINTHRCRDTVPFKDIVFVCIKHELDMNFIFKG